MITQRSGISTSATIPSAFQKALFPDEQVLAVAKKHDLWWIEPGMVIGCIFTLGLYFFYRAYVVKHEILILTDKRIIGSVKPGLLTKDKVDLFFKAVDNIQEDEGLVGNVLGWVELRIETRSEQFRLRQVEKGSAKTFKQKFIEVGLG